MEKEYKQILSKYQKIKEGIFIDQNVGISIKQVEEQQARCASLLQSMANQNQYQHFQQIAAYQDKYQQVKNILYHQRSQKIQPKQVSFKVRQVFGFKETSRPQDPILEGNISSISQIKTGDVVVPEASRTLDMFIKKKTEEISKKQTSFKKILDSKEFQSAQASMKMDTSKHSRFSKSPLRHEGGDKQAKLKKIIDEHKKSMHKLQRKMKQEQELNDFEKNLLREEKNRYLSKVEELEDEIQQLYRDNYRLKQQQKTSKDYDSLNISNPKERDSFSKVYEPYIIKTKHNDLGIINQKNMQKQEAKMKSRKANEHPPFFDPLGDKLEKEKPLTAHDFFNKKPANMGLYGQKYPEESQPRSKEAQNEQVLRALLGDSYEQKQSKGKGASMQQSKPPSNHPSFQQQPNKSFGSVSNGSRFDTFQMANTLSYINDDVLGESRNVARISSETATRNKVAFFKNSLVLVRTGDYEIAYKKSDINESMDKLRLIFYVNNKSSTAKRINFKYEFQHDYFDLRVQEKLTQVTPNSQGRQVIEIKLISKTDLNGVTDMHVEVGDAVYDLWLPVNFIRFKESNNHRLSGDTMEMTVLPDRQFSSFSNTQQLLPVMFGGRDTEETWAYLYGQSKYGNHVIKLTWHIHDLTIETSQKWLDYIGFVLHFFK